MIRTALMSSVRGFAMGAADVVPGVSGGTIALMLGIYERLVASVRSGSSALGHLARFDFAGFKKWFNEVDWVFILPLGAGILTAVVALSSVIEHLLETQAVLMAALFGGLVGGSIIVAWAMRRNRTWTHLSVATAVAVVAFIALGLRGGTTSESVIQAVDPSILAFLGSGALAITAMILPGISGSFILVLLGMYGPVLAAVTERDFASLGVFMVGAVIGLALFSQILHFALERHHDVMIAVLVGLMAGSLRVLWPWPHGVFSTTIGAPGDDLFAALAIAAAALVAVVVVSRFAQRFEASDQQQEASD